MKEEEKEQKVTLSDLIWALAHEVASLKEDRCENEGKNWFDRFKYGINKVFTPSSDIIK